MLAGLRTLAVGVFKTLEGIVEESVVASGLATVETSVTVAGVVVLMRFDTNSFASLFNRIGVVGKFALPVTEESLSEEVVSSAGKAGVVWSVVFS